MNYAYKKEDVPTEPHFAIIVFGRQWHPGYDKGDDDYTSEAIEYYEWTLDITEWENECIKRASDKYSCKDFVPLEVKPRQIKQTFTLG